jgi:2-dehydro-3-deoxyphosphogluconate aldolase/(4S)-4-hydroxy-2-oxoglutarate aldolase
MSFSWERYTELPVIGILRGFDRSVVEAAAAAAGRGGLVNIEVTMNTAAAAELISMLVANFGDEINIGAGTVCTVADCEAAVAAGAGFVVTPVTAPEVIKWCAGKGIPIFAGAFTPTEVWHAWQLGADRVKVFPADAFGPSYLRSLRGPLDSVRLVPTGGVTVENIADYLAAGADGFGVGGPLFDRQRLAAGDWGWVEEQAGRFAAAYAAAAR